MQIKQLTSNRTLLLSLLLIGIGLLLVIWLATHATNSSQAVGAQSATMLNGTIVQTSAQITDTAANTQTGAVSSQPSGRLNPDPSTLDWRTRDEKAERGEKTISASVRLAPVPITVGLAAGVPLRVLTSTLALTATAINAVPALSHVTVYTESVNSATLYFDFSADQADAEYRYTFAAATRFDTLDLTVSSKAIKERWQEDVTGAAQSEEQGEEQGEQAEQGPEMTLPYTTIAVLTATLPALTTMLGKAGPAVIGYESPTALVDAAWADQATLVLIPFDLLTPRLAALLVDGQTPVENANNFDAAAYPLTTAIYAHLNTTDAIVTPTAQALLAQLPPGNRDATQLTVVAMTGVTAMVRLTAAEMDERGNEWPAAVVGPLLATADITAISNEVPFVPGCQTDTRMDNLTFCSKPAYMAALTAAGVDIIGLTGNHQNDFGREDALKSLAIYDAAGLPVYGGGRNKEEAFAPLYLEHNGNRLAFLGANSYGPTFAWATDDLPGSAEFDLSIMSATIRNIKQLGRAEVVMAELQYQETYEVTPLAEQRQDFNALIEAGADIVTGVQSHVPQSLEFTDGKLVLYGLGNLFFDQMWSQSTREGLIVKHTIYNNRHISTQIFTTMLYDYGQPRWTTPEEHDALLQRVYGASFW